MEEKTKDLLGNEKTPIKLTAEEFDEYSKNVKSIYFSISYFANSFLLSGVAILLFEALQALNIIPYSDMVKYILSGISVILLILSWVLVFKNIVDKSKKIYLDRIILVNANLLAKLKEKQKRFKLRVILLAFATLIFAILGVALMVITQDRYPYVPGYTTLSVAAMFLLIIIPLFFTIYFYSDIYIINYIDRKYNYSN
jgi:hypothetical protein